MFANIFNSIAEKLSGLNPIKGFIKYALDKFLNQLINDQITLEDFKGGCLNLANISFNVDKVNYRHLVSSPYILHSGNIGNLKIQLPPLSEIGTKSIQVQIKQVLIQLKPNKNFYESFKQAMIQQQQNLIFDSQQSLPQQQISQNNPMDYFKQTLKRILLNIKVKVENIVIKVYMNSLEEGAEDKKVKKNQFYLLMRIPFINVHKNNDYKTKVSTDYQEIKLDIQMPQFTMHLLNQGINAQNYYGNNSSNQAQSNNNSASSKSLKQKGYPFKFPTINHPSTIFLFGLHDYKSINIQTDKTIPRLTFSISTDYKNKKRQMKINALASNIQIMLDPLQIKVFSRFIYQIKQFKNILDYVKNQLNLNQQIQQSAIQDISSSILRRSKSSQKKNEDIFSSICMSIWEPQGNNKSRISGIGSKIRKTNNGGLLNNMLKQNNDLYKSVHNFNVQFKKNLEEQAKTDNNAHKNQSQPSNKIAAQLITSELRIINFSKNIEINLQVNDVYVYVFKSNTVKPYARKWMSSLKQKKVNTSIPLSHFMFSLKNFKFNFKQQAKTNQISISKLKLQNIILWKHNYQEVRQSESESQFVDIRSSSQFFASCRETFQSFDERIVKLESNISNQQHLNDDSNLEQFQLNEKDHYCIQQIIRISQKASQNIYSQKIRKYNFLPKSKQQQQKDYILYKPGFKFHYNNKKATSAIKIDLLQISVSLNPQIVKEILDIYYPVFHFKKLTELIKPSQQQSFQSQLANKSFASHSKNKIPSQQISFSKNKTSNNIQPTNQPQNQKRSLLQSQYNFGIQYSVMNQFIENRQKPIIKINIQQINLGFFQSNTSSILNHNNLHLLTQKYHQHGPTTCNQCFCQLSSKGLYFECFNIEIDKKQEDIKIGIKKIVTGLIELKNSKINNIKALFIIDSVKNEKNFKIVIQKNQQKKKQNVFLVIPGLSVNLEEEQVLNCITFIKSQIQTAQTLVSYNRYLKNSMQLLSKQAFNLQRKSNKKNLQKYQLNLQLYVQTSRIVLLKTEIYFKHIYLKKYNDQIIFKFSTFVLSLKEPVQLFLNEMKNQELCLREFIQKTSRYSDIHDSSIMVEMHDETYKPEAFESKSRHLFFDKLAKTKGSFIFFMNKNSLGQSNSNRSKQAIVKGDKFQFTKKPSTKSVNQIYSNNSSSVIMQQQQIKSIIINITAPIYVSASNICRLIEDKAHIEAFVQKIKVLQNQIALQTKGLALPERKNSTDSDIQKFQEMKIQISAGKLNVDIRPSFIEKLYKCDGGKNNSSFNKKHHKRQIVFCSTRSYLQLQWDTINIKIQKRIELTRLSGIISLKYYFLQHEQRQIVTNPVFLHEKQLIPLGFLQLFEIKGFDFNIQKIKNDLRIKSQIASINYESSISTLSYLQLHLEHFMNHNVKRYFGRTVVEQEEHFQVIDIKDIKKQNQENKITEHQSATSSISQPSIQIQDLTDAFQKYTQKFDKKKKQQQQFKQKPFTEPKLSSQQSCQLFIEYFKIKQFKVKIYSGSDFQFLQCQSLHQSKEKKRSRVNDTEILKYLQIRIDCLWMGLKTKSLKDIDLDIYLRLQNFEINYSYKKKNQGLTSWFSSNKYSEQVIFPILHNIGQIKLLLEINEEKTYFKMNKTIFDVGFTNDILQLMDEIKIKNNLIKDSGWKKVYQEIDKKKQETKKQTINENQQQNKAQNQQKPSKNPKLLLIYIPQNRLNVKKLIYKGMELLSNQSIYAGQFLLHQQIRNVNKINKIVIKWVKKLILRNISGLLTGTALNFVGNIIEDMLQVVKFLLGLIFRNNGAIEAD